MGADPRAALLAWCDETERIAREATSGPWESEISPSYITAVTRDVCTDQFMRAEDRAHVVRHDPSSVLAQVAAIRAVVGLHRPYDGDFDYATCFLCGVADGSWPCTTLLELADGFAPDWRG